MNDFDIAEEEFIKEERRKWNIKKAIDPGLPWFFKTRDIANPDVWFEKIIKERDSRTPVLNQLEVDFNLWKSEVDFNLWKSEIDNNDYLLRRKKEYPSTEEKVDALWDFIVHNNSSRINELKNSIEAIDAKYPKA